MLYCAPQKDLQGAAEGHAARVAPASCPKQAYAGVWQQAACLLQEAPQNAEPPAGQGLLTEAIMQQARCSQSHEAVTHISDAL